MCAADVKLAGNLRPPQPNGDRQCRARNRSTYAEEKRRALNLWATHIQTLLARSQGANVTALRRA